MDQDVLVTEKIEGGRQLIAALRARGFETRAAFWAKPSDRSSWSLFLASPFVDEKGIRAAYEMVTLVIRDNPECWIDDEVRVIGANDLMAKDALEAIQPKPWHGPNVKPFPGLTRFGRGVLGRVEMDGVAIYPLSAVTAA